jgi:hypothetical protein
MPLAIGVSPLVSEPSPVTLGESIAVLNGPWRFRTGDNLLWADPGLDDSSWEIVDLTPPAGAHDADVGLTGYVTGWAAKGHPRYSGYAWYRIRLSISASPTDALALSGPRAVDSAYQVFVNGRLLGSAGDFSGSTPVAYSIQPRVFTLPPSLRATSHDSGSTLVIAIRVWMGAGLAGLPGTGGIHIAPALGLPGAMTSRNQLEWLETVRGYIVEVVEALAFVLLGAMAMSLVAFDRSPFDYYWLSGGLLLLAIWRANQAFLFWTQYESVYGYDLLINVFVMPLALGVWTMAWVAWFRLPNSAWLAPSIGALTLLYMISQLLGRSWFPLAFLHPFDAGFHTLSVYLRWFFVLLTIVIVYRGIRTTQRGKWLAVAAIALLSIALFAQELSSLHLRSIWFPFGTGVSRTQFAYIGFDFVLAALLWKRLFLLARSGR